MMPYLNAFYGLFFVKSDRRFSCRSLSDILPKCASRESDVLFCSITIFKIRTYLHGFDQTVRLPCRWLSGFFPTARAVSQIKVPPLCKGRWVAVWQLGGIDKATRHLRRCNNPTVTHKVSDSSPYTGEPIYAISVFIWRFSKQREQEDWCIVLLANNNKYFMLTYAA